MRLRLRWIIVRTCDRPHGAQIRRYRDVLGRSGRTIVMIDDQEPSGALVLVSRRQEDN